MAGVAALSFPSTSCSCRFRPAVACAPRHPPGRRLLRRFDEVEGVSKKRRGIGGGGGGSQASSSRKDRGLAVDFKEPQVADLEDLEEDKFLNAVVKVYCTHIAPDYGLPWQKQRQHASTGSAFMIGDGKLLTNAHCVEHDTQVKVKRRGDDKKYIAKVLARGIECDLALLSVENDEFWQGTEPLHLGRLPCLQDSVTVVGYPLGGDTISVTKGVVSRIEVTPYAHGTSDLLGIQIDAAINPGLHSPCAFAKIMIFLTILFFKNFIMIFYLALTKETIHGKQRLVPQKQFKYNYSDLKAQMTKETEVSNMGTVIIRNINSR